MSAPVVLQMVQNGNEFQVVIPVQCLSVYSAFCALCQHPDQSTEVWVAIGVAFVTFFLRKVRGRWNVTETYGKEVPGTTRVTASPVSIGTSESSGYHYSLS
jgi:hypothetical protein